jgi:hypothetical protein
MIGCPNVNFVAPPNQSSHVLMVVVLSSPYVFRMIAHLERRMPLCGFCLNILFIISAQQQTLLPLPSGPRMPRKKAFDL